MTTKNKIADPCFKMAEYSRKKWTVLLLAYNYFWFDEDKTTTNWSDCSLLGCDIVWMIWRNMLPPFSWPKWMWAGNTDMLHGRQSLRSTRTSINWFWLIFWCISHFATTAMKAQDPFLASPDGNNVKLYVTADHFMRTLHSKHKHMKPLWSDLFP